MPRGNRSKFFKNRTGLACIAFALTVTTLVIGGIELKRRGAYEGATRNANYYAKAAQNNVRSKCAGLSGQRRIDCAQPIEDTARQNQREEYDLYAQKTMALWTAPIGWMAVLGVALSGVGVYLIWVTFQETRNANDIARLEMARAQKEALDARNAYLDAERAIIEIEHVKLCPGSLMRKDRYFLVMSISNKGKSNATQFQIFYKISSEPIFSTSGIESHNFRGICIPGDKGVLDNLIIRYPKTTPSYIIGYISYRTLYDGYFKTFFCFRIIDRPFENDEGEWEPRPLAAFMCQNLPPDS